jgi:hypothetical protein
MATCARLWRSTRTLDHNPGLLQQFADRSNKKTWKHWGLAIIVNLGAAVAAALPFFQRRLTRLPFASTN